MSTNVAPVFRRIAALVSIALVASGCAGLPPVGDVGTVSLRISPVPLTAPQAAVSGESDLGPGRAAKAVVPPPDVCTDVIAIVCAVTAIVAVPIAAIVGAAAKTSQKLPQEQAVALNRVTADVTSQLNLAASFHEALQTEAQRRGITLNVANAGATVLVEPLSLSWNISAGNRVAVRMEISVTVRLPGERGTREVTYRGASAQVDDWIADSGQPIQQTLEDAMIGASQLVWDRVLGPAGSGT